MGTPGHLLERTALARTLWPRAARTPAPQPRDRSLLLCRPAQLPEQGPATSHPRHSLCLGRSHQGAGQAPLKRADQAERVAAPKAPGPPPTRRRVLRLGSAPARDSSGPCRDHLQAATVRFSTSPALTAFGTCRTSQDVRLGSAKWAKADIDQVAVIAIL